MRSIEAPFDTSSPSLAPVLGALLLILVPLLLVSAAEAREGGGDSQSQTRWRWLGVKATGGASCPVPAGSWMARPTFPAATPGSVLAEYCTYDFTAGRAVTAADEAQLRALVPAELSELATDSMAMGSLGTQAPQSLWKPLAAYFLDQVGATALPTIDGQPPVRLAVLDTHPTDDIDPVSLPSNSPHGHTLLSMAERMLCSADDECVVHLASRLALSYVSYDPDDPTASVQDPVLGGFVGTIGELAEAIYAETEYWRDHAPGQRLVLNLSVGWNPSFGGLEPLPADMPLAARMVYDAIAGATCKGALVVAATGNRSGGPGSGTGPMMPAAWATRPAPSDAACGASLPKNPQKQVQSGPRPLLYAAGGVQGSGEPLSNSRPGSLPERLAFGDHGVVASQGGPTAILTGSSVATLVTSAAAAASWYYAPQLEAEQIMHTVDGAGDSLSLQADFCFDPAGGCPAIRRVSVCASVAAACAYSSQGCPASACQPWDPSPVDLSVNLAQIAPALTLDLDAIQTIDPGADVCLPNVSHFDPTLGPAADPCPDRQYESVEATPWVHPQPGSHACPPCRVHEESQQLIIEIDPEFSGALSEPTLDLCGNSYSLGEIPLTPGATTVVENVDVGNCDDATVSFTVTDNGVVSSSIDAAMIVQ